MDAVSINFHPARHGGRWHTEDDEFTSIRLLDLCGKPNSIT